MKDFKFIIGEKVKVRGSGKEGTIKNQKLETYKYQSELIMKYTYNVYFGIYNDGWFTEEQLESMVRYSFDDEFELGLRDLMINIHLDKGEFDIIRELQQKKTYEIRRSI